METVPQVINEVLIFCNYMIEWLNLGDKNKRNRQQHVFPNVNF